MASYSTPPVIPLGTFGASTASASICSSVQNRLLAWQNTLPCVRRVVSIISRRGARTLNKSQRKRLGGGLTRNSRGRNRQSL